MALENYHLLRRSFTVKPPVAVKGEGSYVYMDDGSKIIDASGGAAVLSIGHGNVEVAEAMAEQAKKVCYVTPSYFTNEAAEALADEIITPKYENMGYSKIMFVNSGSEANENAYKMVRQYFYERGEYQRVNMINREISYHGNTIISLSMSGTKHRQQPFDDVLPKANFFKVSTPHTTHLKLKNETDSEYVKRLLKELEHKFEEIGSNTVMAVMFEPIVGTSGGCARPPAGYLKGVKQICNKYGALLVYDEVICGSGRCGKYYFAWEHLIDDGDSYEDIQPDIITVGKSLAGGYAPLSALIIHKKLINNFVDTKKTFTSGHTFQAHIVSCAGALAVQKYIKRNNLLDNVSKMGTLLGDLLKDSVGNYKCVSDIRGLGLFWTVELVKDKETMEFFPLNYDFGSLAHDCIIKQGVSVYGGRGSVDGVKGYGFLVSPAFNCDEKLIRAIVEAIKIGLQEAMTIADKDLL